MTAASNVFPPIPRGIDPTVVRSIRQASAATNTDFGLLMAQAAQESGLQADAKAAGSSAAGLFQFIDSTWLDMVRRFGGKYGVGGLAQQISVNDSGKPVVADPATRQRILEMRKDPQLSAALAGEYTRMNKAEVERALGRPVGRGELYLAHFLGAAGATAFLKGVATKGDTPAADLLPEAAAANRSVFYDPSGRARSLGEIYRSLTGRIEQEARNFASDMAGIASVPATPAPVAAATSPIAVTGGLAAQPLNGKGAPISAPLVAMLDVVALAALKLVGDSPSPASHTPPRERRSL